MNKKHTVLVDVCKLPIYRKFLKNYSYHEEKSGCEGKIIIKIKINSKKMHELKEVLENALEESKKG
jgi:hypothetical protein